MLEQIESQLGINTDLIKIYNHHIQGTHAMILIYTLFGVVWNDSSKK